MKSDSLIRRSASWEVLFSTLRSLPAKEKGDVFERVVRLYLETHPEYESTLSSVWLLNDTPEKIKTKLNLPQADEGIDLVAETVDGKYWAIQAKFRSDPNSRLTNKRDLATFTALAFHTCTNIEYGLICATTSQPIKKVDLLGDNVGFRLFSDFEALDENGGVGWKRLKSALAKTPKPPKKYSPKPHQKRAIKNAETHFVKKQQSRGKMIMPCGTGKSLTGFWIGQNLGAKRIVVAVPSLALVKQTLNVWTREYLAHGIKPRWLCVCSDVGSGEVDADAFTAHTYDLGVPCTTNLDEITEFLIEKADDPKIVFTTYQSGRGLADAAQKAGVTFDMGIMDEAHKTVGRKDKVFAHLLSDESIEISKRVFMTATERQFVGSSDDIVSMDDTDIYGETFELLTFKEAIEADNPIICDYKFVTIEIREDEIRQLWEENKFIQIGSDDLDEVATRALAAGLALRKAYTDFNIKRAISFHGSIKKASDFKKQQEAITEVFPELAEVECYHVSGKIPTGKRTIILRSFANSERGLITNARCLTEGIDIPTVDCVLFADPRRSVIDIVQAAGRAMRKAPGKEYGYIIVPLIVPDDADPDEFAQGTEFKEVVRTIRPLAINDSRIVDYFRAVSEDDVPATGSPLLFEGLAKQSLRMDEESFGKSIQLKIWKKLAKLNFRSFEEARKFARTLSLRTNIEWRKFTKSDEMPPDIPVNPDQSYQGKGWQGYGDWLGTGAIANKERSFRPFKEAREYVRSLKLRGGPEWREYRRSGELPSDIPSNPNRAYKNEGWRGMGDWLGTGNVATYERKYRSFNEARSFVRSLNLKSQTEWVEFTKSDQMPEDIPASVNTVYKNDGWAGMGDFLGTGNIHGRYRTYLPFNEARDFIHSLRLKNSAEWEEYSRSKRPSNIPGSPAKVYKNKGWAGLGDWLGTGVVAPQDRRFRPFEKAREFVRALGINNQKEWRMFTRSGGLPSDIPANPNIVYKHAGWIGTGDWLGTGRIRVREYQTFVQARAFARSLNLKTRDEWIKYTRSESFPFDIPKKPERVYKNEGWISIGDWLGTGVFATQDRVYRLFEEARECVRALGLNNQKEWRMFTKSGDLPSDIPADPARVYKHKGWISIGDWLGTGRIAGRDRVFRSFRSARVFTHSQKLKNLREWQSFAKSTSRPSDIPSHPDRTYRNEGWSGWKDWLGTE